MRTRKSAARVASMGGEHEREERHTEDPALSQGPRPGGRRMKAIVQDRYGSADVLEFRDIDDPVASDGDVLVRVRAAGCGPDVWHLMTGLPYMARLAVRFRRPKGAVRG